MRRPSALTAAANDPGPSAFKLSTRIVLPPCPPEVEAHPRSAPSAFDDRSVPFAIGSLSYSRTVTYIVRAWLAAWDGAHGDLGRTPYMRPSDTDSDNTNGRP